MMKKFILSFLTGAISVVFAATAFAAELPSNGVYVEGNLGYGKVNEKVLGATKQKNHGLAGSVNAGYLFNQNVGVEVGYTRYKNQDFGPGVKGDQNYSMDAALKGILPVGQGFSVFGKVGVASVHHRISGVTTAGTFHRAALLVGAGVGYQLTNNLGISAQVNATTKNDQVPAMYLGTVGLTYTIN
ncbi:MAG: porin family protein [Legionellales bacterium]|nr:porin family protein [Legionellales bacterium]